VMKLFAGGGDESALASAPSGRLAQLVRAPALQAAVNPTVYVKSSGGNSAGGGGNGHAPSNGTTPSHCAATALKKNGVALALDAAGVGARFLPGGDLVVAGAGIAIGTASVVKGAMSANTTTPEGQLATGGAIAGIFDIQLAALAPAAKWAGMGAKAVPFLGALVSAAGGAIDLYQTGADYAACMAGH